MTSQLPNEGGEEKQIAKPCLATLMETYILKCTNGEKKFAMNLFVGNEYQDMFISKRDAKKLRDALNQYMPLWSDSDTDEDVPFDQM